MENLKNLIKSWLLEEMEKEKEEKLEKGDADAK